MAAALIIFFFTGFWSLLTNLSGPEANLLKNKDKLYDYQTGTRDSGAEPKEPGKIQGESEEGVLVTRVIDGDTIEIDGGQKVRYIGIDTPETVDPRTTVQCFGKEAAAKNKELVEGKKVRLEKDVSETDKYGRLLRYLYIGDVFVNKVLVQEGYAFSSPYPPDIKYQDLLNQAQKEAREKGLGLWGSCPVSNKTTSTAPNSDCVIKGNISSNGEKIYHLPGQRYYNSTVITESKGERWFCSEEEALAAGWRKSKV